MGRLTKLFEVEGPTTVETEEALKKVLEAADEQFTDLLAHLEMTIDENQKFQGTAVYKKLEAIYEALDGTYDRIQRHFE